LFFSVCPFVFCLLSFFFYSKLIVHGEDREHALRLLDNVSGSTGTIARPR
jgi:hypothetical protein